MLGALGVSSQLVALVLLLLAAFYLLLLMIQKMMPKKQHKYTGGVDAQGRYDGYGTLIAINGDTYSGDFRAGTFHGSGSYTFFKGGGSYTGEFRDGLFAGQGKEVYPDGSVYVGGFDNSKRSGLGTMHYSNGAVFTGHWKNGKKEGRGVFKYSDGTRFDGRFVDGRRDGVGFIYDKKNRKLQGKWKNGKLVNNGKLTRVMHKDKEKDKAAGSGAAGGNGSGSGEDDLSSSAGGRRGSRSASSDLLSALAADDEASLAELEAQDPLLADSAAMRPKQLRQRHVASSSSAAAAGSGLLPLGASPASGTPKRLSASKEKELSNQLLNFSKKQQSANHFTLLSRSITQAQEARQARERSELINQLARSRSHELGVSTTSAASSSSSSSSSASTSHSSAASTTAQSPTLSSSISSTGSSGSGKYRGPSAGGELLAPLMGDSSGIESELATADDADDDTALRSGGVHGLLLTPTGRAGSSAGDWTADSPTHVSNAHSLAATPSVTAMQQQRLLAHAGDTPSRARSPLADNGRSMSTLQEQEKDESPPSPTVSGASDAARARAARLLHAATADVSAGGAASKAVSEHSVDGANGSEARLSPEAQLPPALAV